MHFSLAIALCLSTFLCLLFDDKINYFWPILYHKTEQNQQIRNAVASTCFGEKIVYLVNLNIIVGIYIFIAFGKLFFKSLLLKKFKDCNLVSLTVMTS